MTAISTHADLEGAIAADHMRCSKLTYFGELGKLVQLEARFKHRFAGQIETFISDKDCLDVMPCNVSKGDALKLLIQEPGIASDEIACIGDSFNDLSMFALTPHCFAMRESRDEIRSRASTVVHSVAEAIDHIIIGGTTKSSSRILAEIGIDIGSFKYALLMYFGLCTHTNVIWFFEKKGGFNGDHGWNDSSVPSIGSAAAGCDSRLSSSFIRRYISLDAARSNRKKRL